MPWFAIRTRLDFRAAEELRPLCDDIFFPTETLRREGQKPRVRALIPHVLFIKTTPERALELERNGHRSPPLNVPFWIYRYPSDQRICHISESHIRLLRLITADDPTRCEIFTKTDFTPGQRVRITGGIYQGYEGFVKRVRRDRHVIVSISGVCLVMLPFIHPDLLEEIKSC